jgi:outer membrane protein OmpA-like peptidoglycan-associated protein
MKFTNALLWAALCAAVPAGAAERETMSMGADAPDAKKVEGFLFPEAECESTKYQCMAVRPSSERSIGMEVKFPTGSATLTPEAKTQLDGLGKVLASRKGKLGPGEILIEGHADARGSADYNRKLSQERAQSVVKHLVTAYGVESKALTAVGMGASHLKDPSKPDAQVNRRVEFVRKPN